MNNKSNLKRFIVLSLVVIVLVVSSFFILKDARVANNSVVMQIKNVYYLNILPNLGFKKNTMPYTILPINKDQKYGYYTYSLVGKFEKIDFLNSFIYLKDKNDQTYAITYLIKRSPDNEGQIFFDYFDVDNQGNITQGTVTIDVFRKGDTVSPFNVGDTIEIQWDSFSTLDQILKEKKDNEILIERQQVIKGVTQTINRL